MTDNKSKLTIEDYKSDFVFKKKENGLNIQFNRVAFIFFVFFIIYLIYTIHLVPVSYTHLRAHETCASRMPSSA